MAEPKSGSAPGLSDAFWKALPLGPGVELICHDPNGLAALAKPVGVLSHPNEPGDQKRSLLSAPYSAGEGEFFEWTSTEGGAGRAQGRLWLLNRLDGGTSGVVMVSADGDLAASIKRQFREQHIEKIYQAVVFGRPAGKEALWEDRLTVDKRGGQVRTQAGGHVPASTYMRFVRHRQAAFSFSLLQLEPRTGRSHQLRVQCARRQLPIVGDATYGDFRRNRDATRATGEKRMFLHSLTTRFTYEWQGRRHAFEATAPLPESFARLVG